MHGCSLLGTVILLLNPYQPAAPNTRDSLYLCKSPMELQHEPGPTSAVLKPGSLVSLTLLKQGSTRENE